MADQATGVVLRWASGNFRASASRVDFDATAPAVEASCRNGIPSMGRLTESAQGVQGGDELAGKAASAVAGVV